MLSPVCAPQQVPFFCIYRPPSNILPSPVVALECNPSKSPSSVSTDLRPTFCQALLTSVTSWSPSSVSTYLHSTFYLVLLSPV